MFSSLHFKKNLFLEMNFHHVFYLTILLHSFGIKSHYIFKRNTNNHASSEENVLVQDVLETFTCGSKIVCTKIHEFYINSHYNFNCYHSYLPIKFSLTVNGSIAHYTGFLPPNGVRIQLNQKNSDICKKIKK